MKTTEGKVSNESKLQTDLTYVKSLPVTPLMEGRFSPPFAAAPPAIFPPDDVVVDDDDVLLELVAELLAGRRGCGGISRGGGPRRDDALRGSRPPLFLALAPPPAASPPPPPPASELDADGLEQLPPRVSALELDDPSYPPSEPELAADEWLSSFRRSAALPLGAPAAEAVLVRRPDHDAAAVLFRSIPPARRPVASSAAAAAALAAAAAAGPPSASPPPPPGPSELCGILSSLPFFLLFCYFFPTWGLNSDFRWIIMYALAFSI